MTMTSKRINHQPQRQIYNKKMKLMIKNYQMISLVQVKDNNLQKIEMKLIRKMMMKKKKSQNPNLETCIRTRMDRKKL